MRGCDGYGICRSLEPKGSLPQPAWKLDNTMEPRPNELLVELLLLCVNMVSFNEILASADYRDDLVKKRIMDIVHERGKLHNPVTGTGGMFFGRVARMGARYPNRYGVNQGDEIVSLMSLSATPVRIEKICSIDYANAQLEVIGQAILFENSPLLKKPLDLPLKLLVSAMDEAGAPRRTYTTVREGQSVLIMGAGGKVGLLCAYAAKDKLNGTGRLVGLVKDEESYRALKSHDLFQELIVADASDFASFPPRGAGGIEGDFDIAVNCINSPNTEMFGLMAIRDGGTLYFASMSCDYKFAALTAESIGKEVSIIPYTGYIEGHADYTLGLLRRFGALRDALRFAPRSAPAGARPAGGRLPDTPAPAGMLDGYIFDSDASRSTLNQALKVAQFNSNVMIYGESGVGKEKIAQIIHLNSERKSFPMIKINCAAIPENLLESELFGYEKGSFTGASQKGKIGLWEAAQNGTLFLDEVSELSLSLQAKLLRVIQEKEIVRVGGIAPIKVDVRIVAATNSSLVDLIERNLFREDLYYRLNVFPIVVLPLRKRKSDIVPLASFLVERYNAEFGMDKKLSPAAGDVLRNLPLRGNIRELQNLVQRMMIIADAVVLEPKDVIFATVYDQEEAQPARSVPIDSGEPTLALPGGLPLKVLLGKAEASILREYKKLYTSTRRMAKALQVSQPSVVRKLKQYGLNDEPGGSS